MIPICHGTNSLSPNPSNSLVEGAPDAVFNISSKMRCPISWTAAPLVSIVLRVPHSILHHEGMQQGAALQLLVVQ
jgi:hypothetical protein